MKIISIMLTLVSITLNQCNQNPSNKETATQREQRLISEYERKTVIEKGMETYFIPREHVSWFYYKENFYDTNQAKVNDNVCFFDTLGNIVYQARVVDILNSTKIIKCQNLKTAEYYITVLKQDSILDLKKQYPLLIKLYRDDGRKCPTCK